MTFNMTMEWTKPKIIDKEFVWIKTQNMVAGAFQETNFDATDVAAYYRGQTLIFHPEFEILHRCPNAYVASGGKILMVNTWLPEQDEKIKYLEDNFDRAPIGLKELLTNVQFDWNKRTWSRVLDLSLRPLDMWVDANMDWSIMYGGFVRQDLLTNDTVLYAMPNKDLLAWRNKTIKLSELGSVVYDRPDNVELAYLAVIGGHASFNGEDAPLDTIVQVQSNSVIIGNVDSPVVLVREKYAAN